MRYKKWYSRGIGKDNIAGTKDEIKIMISLLLLMFSLFAIFLGCQNNVPNAPGGWTLLWSDEFDYSGTPDPDKWVYENGMIRNEEAQYYTTLLENAEVTEGCLVITARKENYEDAAYTSASVNTKGRFSFQGGRVEVRARLPEGRGVWPAIWTLGVNIDDPDVTWRACGEIDIMEFVGYEGDTVYCTVHTRDYGQFTGKGRGSRIRTERPFDDFHIYALEWYDDRMDFYFDDTNYFTCHRKGEGFGEWPFDSPQYLLINLAIGGTWGGLEGIDDAIFPVKYWIDYVRIFGSALL
jgi:beta-glucanase (GH16 family)